MTTAPSAPSVLRKYRVLYAVTRAELYEIEAADADEARREAYTEGTLVLIGDNTDVTDCEDVEIAAFSAPLVVEDFATHRDDLAPPKK
jgi:hypothetical protein